MHVEAEFGVAAHWRYKSQQESSSEGERQLQWLRSLPGQHRESTSHAEFVRKLRRQVFEDRMVVFGAAGRRLRLPDGSTVRDYLHRTGSLCKATTVRVNRQPVSHDHILQDGDNVELLESTEPPDPPG